MHQRVIILVTSFLISIAGCASKDLASNEADDLAKQFRPLADKSFVYVLRRRSIIGSAVSISLALDGVHVGDIQNSTYVLLDVPPKEHKLTVDHSSGGMPVSFEFETLPGRSYFVVAKHKMGSIVLEIIQNKEGEKLVRKYKRVVSALDTV